MADMTSHSQVDKTRVSRREALSALGASALSLATFSLSSQAEESRSEEGPVSSDYHPEIQRYKRVNEELSRIGSTFAVSNGLHPINFRIEKAKFLKDPSSDPDFRYPPLPKAIGSIIDRVKGITIPRSNKILAGVMREYQQNILSACAMLVAREDRASMIEHSQQIFGAPSVELQSEARRLLRRFPVSKRESHTISAFEASKYFKSLFDKHGYIGWRTELSEQDFLSVDRGQKILNIPKHRMYGEVELQLLDLHERSVHINRSINGALQPLPLFHDGFPGYMSTEEGLAVYAELHSGLEVSDKVRIYAARVLAVRSLLDGGSFSETFHHLLNLSFSERDAWGVTFKVFRGGGYVRDHCYLQGYSHILKYLEEGKSLRDLFVGKIGVDDLETVSLLREMELVREPLRIPDFCS